MGFLRRSFCAAKFFLVVYEEKILKTWELLRAICEKIRAQRNFLPHRCAPEVLIFLNFSKSKACLFLLLAGSMACAKKRMGHSFSLMAHPFKAKALLE